MMINNMMIDNNNIKNGYNYKITIISILVKIKKYYRPNLKCPQIF